MMISDPMTNYLQANFARWEPGHGRFHFCHPWKQYLKIGVLARQCAYRIDALNGYFNSDLQVHHHDSFYVQTIYLTFVPKEMDKNLLHILLFFFCLILC